MVQFFVATQIQIYRFSTGVSLLEELYSPSCLNLTKLLQLLQLTINFKKFAPVSILNILKWKASFADKCLVTASMKGLKHSLVSQENSEKSPNYIQFWCLWQMQALSSFQFNQNIPALQKRTNLNSAIDQW